MCGGLERERFEARTVHCTFTLPFICKHQLCLMSDVDCTGSFVSTIVPTDALDYLYSDEVQI